MNIKRIVIIAAVVTSATLPSSGALVVREATAGMGYAATSVNAAVFRGGSVTSISNIQYVAYYDADGCLTLGRRLLGESEFATQKTQYYGSKTDGHNVISIIVDGDGYLHCSFNQHSSAFHYARSTAPDSLVLGAEAPMIGTLESYVTYPEFHRLADGSLIFFYRDGSSGNGNLVLNRYSLSTRKWTRVHDNIVGGTGTYVGKMYTSTSRNAYPQMCVDKNGVIHLSWVWRESSDVATNHDMCYAKSEDGGVTWKKSDGTAYDTIPITIDTAEQVWEIPQQSELINQTSMTTMPDGRPVIATYWRSSDSSVPQYRLLYLATDGTWKMRQISNRTTAFSLSGSGTKAIPIARPQVVSDDRRMMVMTRDVERGWKASLYVSTPTDDGEWEIMDLTDYAVNEWEPSYDRELWRDRGWLDIYVQDVAQGDGEGTTTKSATEVRVLEVSAAPEVISTGKRNSMTNAWLKANVENVALQYKFDGVDSLPAEMPDPTTTAPAMCGDMLYAWTDGGWAALGGVDIATGERVPSSFTLPPRMTRVLKKSVRER